VRLWKKHLNQCLEKKRHGRVRCCGRTMTPSILKKNQEVVVADVKLMAWKRRFKV